MEYVRSVELETVKRNAHGLKVPAKDPSRLLSLPRELRDLIYELVLTEEGGLVYDVVRLAPGQFQGRFRAAGSTREANQLRYVNRQLHAETSAISLRYNDISFGSHDESFSGNIYTLFESFVYNCSPGCLRDIKRIEIYDAKTPPPSQRVVLSRLISPGVVRFCREYPQATVVVRFDWASPDAEYLPEEMDCMVYLSAALKRSNPFSRPAGYHPGGLAHTLQLCFHMSDCPENLRFSTSLVFDEDTVSLHADVFVQDGEDKEDADRRTRAKVYTEIARKVHKLGI